MISIANKYYSYGLSVIPIGEQKQPLGKWQENIKSLIQPSAYFTSDKLRGIGIVCGEVSGGLEIIDIDTKYDITGTLFNDYKNSIASVDNELLKKLVVEKTPTGGYHFIYKCKNIDGNLKLANRPTTEEELKKDPKQKVKVLIETRGRGGYFMCAPSEGYELIYGSFDKIQEITPEERETLFDCAKTFNTYFKEVIVKKEFKQVISENVSPFEDYNERGDVLALLQNEGWKITHQQGHRNFLLRPSGTGKWSADYHDDKRLFYVFSTSTEFESERAYNPSQVLTILKFNGDYSECAKWLLKNGFGKFEKTNIPQHKAEVKIVEDDDDYSFLATQDEMDVYITQKRNGTFKMGNTTGFPEFDKYYRFKEAEFDMILGHDNAGKSIISWYFSVLNSYFNDAYYIIFAGENKTGAVKTKLMEFYLCKNIEKMNDVEYAHAKKWVENHYALIRNDEAYSYLDMIAIGRKMLKKKKYTNFIIEPYNVLDKKTTNEHQYDYKAMLDIRLFIKKTGVGVLLNVHAATEALRKVYPKEHDYAGYTMPPNKADAEGGGKFPNKADNFMCVHRMADHPTEWMWTEIHVQKIKEMETGGKRTFKNEPFKIRMVAGGCGFEDVYGYNPMINGRKDEQLIIEHREPTIQPNTNFINPDKRIEPIKDEDIYPF